jgi:hypothetical protein
VHWFFGDIPGAFAVVGEFERVGGATVFDLEDQDKVAAVVFPRRSQNPARRRALLQYFFGVWWDPRFCWGFLQKRVVERGFLMVNLWWIAGESW